MGTKSKNETLEVVVMGLSLLAILLALQMPKYDAMRDQEQKAVPVQQN